MYKNFLFYLLTSLILIGCGGGGSYKGVGGAKPKHEPLSKSGNPATYKALGKSYRLLKTTKGYKQTGYASWYGKDFHGKRTSSGTKYNMHNYSAAHKTLPIPTYVLVTNLENKKKLVLRVDDRGPFVAGRIIDLSYVAAKELDIVGKGTGRVSVEALSPYQSLSNKQGIAIVPDDVIPSAPNQPMQSNAPTRVSPPLLASQSEPSAQSSVTFNDSQNYALQLGAFSNQYNANNFAQSIQHQANQSLKVHFDGRLYRVLAGNFNSRNSAENASYSLKQSGLSNSIFLIH